MPVSVDTLIEMCEVKTIVYINARDLCSTIIGLSPPSRDYTGFKWKNGFSYNTILRGFNLDKQHLHMRYYSRLSSTDLTSRRTGCRGAR